MTLSVNPVDGRLDLTGSGSGGDVAGPGSSTDNAIARFDSTTGKLLQDSAVTVDDSGNIATSGTVDGRDLSTDGTKLDGIEASATADQTGAEIKTAYEAEADTNAFTDADHTKLDGIEASATADQTGAEIKTAYEAEADTNAFTDADHTKLDGIEASADVTDATNVAAAGALMTTGGTMAGTINGADNEINRVNLKDYGEVTNAIGSIGGGTQDIDIASGNVVTGTVDTSATTFTFSNPTASDEGCSFTLVLTNGGSQTVTWPASVDWPGGTAPTLTAAGVDVLVFLTVDGGTTWHGMVASADSQ